MVIEEDNSIKQFSVQMIDHSISSYWWKEIMEHFIRVDDKYEVSIKGTVTKDLLEKLLIEEPTDKSIYNKMTKYFTIHVRNDLCDIWSEHYGTELVINITSDADIEFFEQVMRQYPESFSIGINKRQLPVFL